MKRTKNMTTNEVINDWLKQYSGGAAQRKHSMLHSLIKNAQDFKRKFGIV